MTKHKTITRELPELKTLVDQYYIKATPILDEVSINSHNVYNEALYLNRQALFKYIKNQANPPWIGLKTLNKLFKDWTTTGQNLLYRKMQYVQTVQQTLKEVCTIWYAYWKARQAYKAKPDNFSGRPRLPKYLRKGQRHTFTVTNQNARIKNGYLCINKLHVKLKLRNPQIKLAQVSFVPINKGYKVCVQYRNPKKSQLKPDNGRYVAIDPGVDNAFVCVTNTNKRPLIINGRPAKAVNYFYNKNKARLQNLQAQYHQLEVWINTKQGRKPVYKTTHAEQTLTDWRNAKIQQFCHKATKRIIEYALSCDAHTIIIGKNKNWKRSSNMGKKNNQNFIGIPHAHMINMLTYKAALHGIAVLAVNESYTSQTSFLDHEKPIWYYGNNSRKKRGISPIKRRFTRGLFKADTGQIINSDVNGALQILIKAFPKASFADGIKGLVLSPTKWSPLI